jgi:hypothetical protein
VIVLLTAGYLGDLAEAQVIVIRFIKGKYDVDKILTQLYNISYAGSGGKGNHGFCGMNRYVSNFPVAFGKMPEQRNGMVRLAVQKIRQRLISAGMYLIGIGKLLSALRACPHSIR